MRGRGLRVTGAVGGASVVAAAFAGLVGDYLTDRWNYWLAGLFGLLLPHHSRAGDDASATITFI